MLGLGGLDCGWALEASCWATSLTTTRKEKNRDEKEKKKRLEVELEQEGIFPDSQKYARSKKNRKAMIERFKFKLI